MKAYVRGFDTILDEKLDAKKEPKPPQFVVEYRAVPEWVIETRFAADAECQILRRHSVTVETHFCDFSVEELPFGGTASGCAASSPATASGIQSSENWDCRSPRRPIEARFEIGEVLLTASIFQVLS
jgi:hypothetical protein